jgi:hypothetical protein
MPQLGEVALLNSTAADNDRNMHSDFCVLQVISSLRMLPCLRVALSKLATAPPTQALQAEKLSWNVQLTTLTLEPTTPPTRIELPR